MSETGTDPLPQPPSLDTEDTIKPGCRLWVGNLDPRITEFAILKLLQKQGPLEKFDFIYHKSGPDAGKPRGYCFATYENAQAAEKAKNALNGKMALSKRLVVKDANADRKEEFITKFTVTTTNDKKPKTLLSTDMQIQAIEQKLKMMEENKDLIPHAMPGTSSTQHGHGTNVSHRQGQGHSQGRSVSQSSRHHHGYRQKQPYNHGKRR